MPKPSIKKLSIIILAIILLIAGYFILLQKPETAAADWWDDSWLYRQTVGITNTGTAQTDFQVMITLDTTTLITANKIQSDCDDIRITDINGKLIPHWIEPTTCNTATTKIWTKVPSISTSGDTVYLYYGNSAVDSKSSTTDTFIREISGVQGAWDMDEASANTCSGGVNDSCDSSGNGNDGSWQADATSTTGKFGNGVVFDGAGDYIDAGNDSSLDFSTEFSTEFWVKWNLSGTWDVILGRENWNANQGWVVFVNNSDGDVWYNKGGGESIIASDAAPSGSWKHIIITNNNNNATIYVDGNVATNGTVSISNANVNLYIGSRHGNNGGSGPVDTFSGILDNIRIYNTALSQSEISDLYGTGGDRHGYVTTNYPNKSLVRKYSASVTIDPPTGEERGPGPVAFWQFDEGFGQTANDSTINANNGTLGGTSSVQDSDPTWQTEDMCVSGKCLKFDGVDDYVDGGSGTSLDLTGEITMEAWIKPTLQADYQIFLGRGYLEDGTYCIAMPLNSTRIYAWIDGQQYDNASNPQLSVNVWHHVVVSGKVGVNTVKIYVDGNLYYEYSSSSDMIGVSPYNFYIGKDSRTNGYEVNGFIDSVKIYPYARTAAQIKADYASRGTESGVSVVIGDEGKTSLSDGLVGYWKMDEASWNGTADEVVDSSGSGNDGVAVGATGIPTTGAGKFGNGGVFDGVDDYVDISNIANDITTGSFSVSLWFKSSDTESGQNEIFALSDAPSANDIDLIYNPGGSFVFTYHPNSISSNKTSWSTSSWYHVTTTYDTVSGGKLYIDGALDNVNVAAGSREGSPAGTALLGKKWNGSMFLGSIDSVRIYNRALSPGEVRDLYNFAPGPVGWWKMDEKVSGNGQTINDSSGYGNTGTTSSANGTGMDCTVLGKYGSACEFDGVDDYISVSNDNSFLSSQGSVEMWIKPAANRNQYFFGFLKTMFFDYINIEQISQKIRVRQEIDNSFVISRDTSNDVLSINSWNHVAVTQDGTEVKIFVNGILADATGTNSGNWVSAYTSLTRVEIGQGSAGNDFNGSIDDVRIYNYARTQAQIMEDYSAGAGRKQPIAHWKFDEGYGTTANNSGIGGSTLNGTLTNMAFPATSTSGWTDEGKMGKGLVFDGVDDYVDCGSDSGLDIGTGDFSVEFWMKSTQTGSIFRAIQKRGTGAFGTQGGWQISRIYGSTSNDWRNTLFDDGAAKYVKISADGNLDNAMDGNFHHLTFVWVGSTNTLTAYIDGINANISTTVVGDVGSISTSRNCTIGAAWDDAATQSQQYDGSIDDVKIYNYALTEDEVRKEYNQGALLKLGSTGTDSSGNPDDSASREYCIPGDTSTCNPPVGRWDFNEGAGSTVNDTSGKNNTGTWSGAGEHWTQGKIGKGGSFNGSDDCVRTNSTPTLSYITIEAIIKADALGSENFIVTRDDVGTTFADWWLGNSPAGKLTFGARIGGSWNGSVTSDVVLSTGIYYHVALTYDGTTVRIYVDGIEKPNSNPSRSGTLVSSQEIDIACRKQGTAADTWNGIIDQVRIYDYARTPAQIAWDYNRGKPVAHWKFDECQGGTAYDSSGNGNDGTITIGATGTQDGIGTCTDGDTSNAWYNGRTGKYSSAMSFDGSDDYVDMGNNASIKPVSAITIGLWMKTASAGVYQYIIDSNNDSSSSGTTLQLKNNLSSFYVTLGSVAYDKETAFSFNIGQWYYIVYSYDKVNLKTYVNGIERGSFPVAGAPNIVWTSNTIFIGVRKDSNNAFNGLIDEVKIYNYALTAEQIKTEYNGGAVSFR